MKNLKECYFSVLLTVFLINCQQPIAVGKHSDNKELVSDYRIDYFSNDTSQELTLGQLLSVFPDQLSGLKKNSTKLNDNKRGVTAIYGDNQFEINIIDDLSNNYSNVHTFDEKYKRLDSGNMIKSVRDGYRTITTILPEGGETSISFVFKKRYLITVTGTHKQTPYMVWRFLELNKFQKLQE